MSRPRLHNMHGRSSPSKPPPSTAAAARTRLLGADCNLHSAVLPPRATCCCGAPLGNPRVWDRIMTRRAALASLKPQPAGQRASRAARGRADFADRQSAHRMARLACTAPCRCRPCFLPLPWPVQPQSMRPAPPRLPRQGRRRRRQARANTSQSCRHWIPPMCKHPCLRLLCLQAHSGQCHLHQRPA
jgi:hypothetical protein